MNDGVYSLTMDEYRRADGVNHSSLKYIDRSPAHFKNHIDNPPEETREQLIGSILHTAVLEPDLLEGSYHIRPKTYRNKKAEWKKWNSNATEAKDWLAAHEDKPVLRQSEHDEILAMRHYILEHPAASEALAQGKSEQSLFATDPDTGILLKCRSDRLSGNAIIDLKSTDDASPSGFARTIAKFSYMTQAALNLDIATFLGLEKKFFLFVVVEREAPFGVAVYELDQESIDVGRGKYRRWLNTYLHCVTEDEWPAYPSDRQIISLPAYAKKSEEIAMLEYSARPMLPAA